MLHTIRETPRLDMTKVVIVTAVPGRVTSDDATLVQRFFTKPFSPTELAQAVKALLGMVQ